MKKIVVLAICLMLALPVMAQAATVCVSGRVTLFNIWGDVGGTVCLDDGCGACLCCTTTDFCGYYTCCYTTDICPFYRPKAKVCGENNYGWFHVCGCTPVPICLGASNLYITNVDFNMD
ncbi:MAG: hypothetical protein PHW74_03900 [Desulfobacca sp.]|nr:hypothetical protein [Desulfobacca sp.]